MANHILIISEPATARSESREIKGQDASFLLGLKIGESIDLSQLGIQGKARITGGSDTAGFPMRPDVLGGVRRRILISQSVGFKSGERNDRRRKLVRGNTITEEIYQINTVLVEGSLPAASEPQEAATS